MSLVLSKLGKAKPPVKKDKKPSKQAKEDKAQLKKLPTMIKQEATLEDKADTQESKEQQESKLREVAMKLSVDELGKGLKLIWTSDKQKAVASQYQNTQWHNFKNGTKNRVYYSLITNETTFAYEYEMKWDLG